MPAIINSFDHVKMTVTVYPTIQGKIQQPDGSFIWKDMPLLVDVPIVFPSGGGFTMTYPVTEGDEALIVFASRCIDAWWQSGGIGRQAELRMHDLSDGFAFVGPRSQPRVLSGISTTSAQFRSDDGQTFVDVAHGSIIITAPTKVTVNTAEAVVNASASVKVTSPTVTIDSPQTTCTGALTVEGLLTYQAGLAGTGGSVGSNITGNITHSAGVLSSDTVVLSTHTHSGVQPGSGNTGGPN